MIPEESAAYAVATWARFRDNVPDDLLRAICGAFVLIAASDGELASSEVDRFLEVLKSQADVLAAVDFAQLEVTFRDLAEALMSDPGEGRRVALDCIALVKDDEEKCHLVRSAATIAITADEQIRSVEETAMKEIDVVLG